MAVVCVGHSLPRGSRTFAILLVLSRTPITGENVPWPEDFFQKGLVAHVALSFAVWFLAVLGPSTTLPWYPTTLSFRQQASVSYWTKWHCFWQLLEPYLCSFLRFRIREPTLNNYIPVIINPIYYAGLALLAAGILVSVVRVLKNLSMISCTTVDEIPVVMSVGLIYVSAIVALIIAGLQMRDIPLSYDYNENLVWGAGHILQVMNTGLFLIAISLLFRQAFGHPLAPPFFPLDRRPLDPNRSDGTIIIQLLYDRKRREYASLFRLKFVLGVPVSMILIALAAGIWHQKQNFRITDPGGFSLAAAFGVFTTGALFGLFVDGADTRTPAHYHGVIGGINLVFVGLFYTWLLPLLGRAVTHGKLVAWQIGLYASGQWFFIVGMFAAGGMGASRKVMGAGIDVDTLSALAATGTRDLGGTLAIIGGVMFILIVLKALFRPAGTMS